MQAFIETLLRGLPFLLLATVVGPAVGCIAFGRLNHVAVVGGPRDLRPQLIQAIRSGNAAACLRMAGFIAGIMIALSGSILVAGTGDYWHDVLAAFGFSMMTIALMFGALWINDHT